MKNYFAASFMILFLILKSHAQLTDEKITGEYYLEGVMEVGSGFRLLKDHTFDFFFIYGALDRAGKGTWELQGDKVLFNSEPWPGSDFTLAKQQHRSQKEITIQVADRNEAILGYIVCRITGAGRSQEMQAEKDGSITFESQPIDTIVLYHLYFSDELSVFPLKEGTDNYFEFTLQPHLGTVYFKDFTLTVKKNELTGGHPLMKEDKEYRYVKNE